MAERLVIRAAKKVAEKVTKVVAPTEATYNRELHNQAPSESRPTADGLRHGANISEVFAIPALISSPKLLAVAFYAIGKAIEFGSEARLRRHIKRAQQPSRA